MIKEANGKYFLWIIKIKTIKRKLRVGEHKIRVGKKAAHNNICNVFMNH